jgi:hypothetical protein
MLADHSTVQHASSCVGTTIEPQSCKRATYLRSAIAMALLGPFAGQATSADQRRWPALPQRRTTVKLEEAPKARAGCFRTGPEKVRQRLPGTGRIEASNGRPKWSPRSCALNLLMPAKPRIAKLDFGPREDPETSQPEPYICARVGPGSPLG